MHKLEQERLIEWSWRSDQSAPPLRQFHKQELYPRAKNPRTTKSLFSRIASSKLQHPSVLRIIRIEMARTRQRAKSEEPSQPPATLPAASPAPTSNVPPQIRFPLLVFLSLTISAVLYTVISPFTPGDLSIVSNTQDQWWQIAGLNGWKAVQLAVGWFAGYDSVFSFLVNSLQERV